MNKKVEQIEVNEVDHWVLAIGQAVESLNGERGMQEFVCPHCHGKAYVEVKYPHRPYARLKSLIHAWCENGCVKKVKVNNMKDRSS